MASIEHASHPRSTIVASTITARAKQMLDHDNRVWVSDQHVVSDHVARLFRRAGAIAISSAMQRMPPLSARDMERRLEVRDCCTARRSSWRAPSSYGKGLPSSLTTPLLP
eukprot:5259759-Pleurochrysis_carterae.AAC.1